MNDVFIPYKREDVEQERFYRVPKEFIEDDFFRENLDNNMKMMYALLRDRYELSIKNNWFDSNNQVFCIYSRNNLVWDLNISKNTVSKCIKKLTELNLMKEIRYGQGKSNHMYISKVKASHINRSVKFGSQDSQKLGRSDTDLRETEKIKRYLITETVNEAYVFNYYSQRFKNKFKREHPTITASQLDNVADCIGVMRNEYSIDDDGWKEVIDEHFQKLSPKNNGSILSFASGDHTTGALMRYIL